MNILLDKEYYSDYPEQYDWGKCDSHRFAKLGRELAADIRSDLADPDCDRHRVPGLREALRWIAKLETQER